VRDPYTTLKEAYDRISPPRSPRGGGSAGVPTSSPPGLEESYGQVRAQLLAAFADTYSLSLQRPCTRWLAVVEHHAGIDEVRLSLPNKHHFLVDLEQFGLKNEDEVYLAADRPYGLIEGTVLRTAPRPAFR